MINGLPYLQAGMLGFLAALALVALAVGKDAVIAFILGEDEEKRKG